MENRSQRSDASGNAHLAKGRVDSGSHAGFFDGDDRDCGLADAGIGDADADPGEQEARQQRGPLRIGADAMHQQQPGTDQRQPHPEQDANRDPVGERAGDRCGDERENRQRQEAQARLQR